MTDQPDVDAAAAALTHRDLTYREDLGEWWCGTCGAVLEECTEQQ